VAVKLGLDVRGGLANEERMRPGLEDEIGALQVVFETGALTFAFQEASHRGSP
jgi:hypothetical protein